MKPKYDGNDFTLEAYERLLLLAKSKFDFISYSQAQELDNYVLWRHDIDFSVHKAVSLAEIEKKHEIAATYFIHFHSDFYSVLETEIIGLLKRIISLGHNIGLHFDCYHYNIQEEEELNFYLLREKKLLEDFFDREVSVFSFHNTSPFTESCTRWNYGNMINAYADFFKKHVGYCSDSNGYWRFRRLEDVLIDPNFSKLQVLTHPVWWTEQLLSPREKINLCIDGRARKSNQKYDDLLHQFSRENIR